MSTVEYLHIRLLLGLVHNRPFRISPTAKLVCVYGMYKTIEDVDFQKDSIHSSVSLYVEAP